MSKRIHGMPLVVVAGILCFSLAEVRQSSAITDDFTRYQSIIDRKPFGVVLVDPSHQTNALVAPADLFTKTLKMVAIKLDRSGKTRVGFVNMVGNKSYYLSVGEVSNDGIEVLEADFHMEAALLKKDNQMGEIYMNGSHLQSGAATAGLPREDPVLSGLVSSPVLSSKGVRRESYSVKMRKALEERTKILEARSESRSKIPEEEMEKQLQAAQMDIIRQGLPALPMPLTKEMDDQLVAEGILPPLDQ